MVIMGNTVRFSLHVHVVYARSYSIMYSFQCNVPNSAEIKSKLCVKGLIMRL